MGKLGLDKFGPQIGQDVEESMEHLFLACPIAQVCWATIHLQVGLLGFARVFQESTGCSFLNGDHPSFELVYLDAV